MGNNTASIYFRSKKVSLIILAVTALVCSRVLFVFFNDPEGPNLLIIIGLAAAIYLLSWIVYVFGPLRINGFTRLAVVICIQVLLVIGLYFCME